MESCLQKKSSFKVISKYQVVKLWSKHNACYKLLIKVPSWSSFRSFSASSWSTDFCVFSTATYISRSVRQDFSASRTWLSSFIWNREFMGVCLTSSQPRLHNYAPKKKPKHDKSIAPQVKVCSTQVWVGRGQADSLINPTESCHICTLSCTH